MLETNGTNTSKPTKAQMLAGALQTVGADLHYERGRLYPRGAWHVCMTIAGIPFHTETDNLDGVTSILRRLWDERDRQAEGVRA